MDFHNATFDYMRDSSIRQVEFSSLYSACHLGIFDILEESPLSISEIKKKLGFKCTERNLSDVLDILFTIGFLSREESKDSIKYKATSNLFMKTNPHNIASIVEWKWNIMKDILNLPEAIVNGSLTENPFDKLYSSDKAYYFLRAMSYYQKENFKKVIELIDFTKFNKSVDIGGCLGEFSMQLKSKYPHMECINFDLPFVEKYFSIQIDERNMKGKIKYLSGDFFKDEFPKSDVVLMGNILHDWNEEKKKTLFNKAYNSLNEQGIFIIVEDIISKDRKSNKGALAISIMMLVECNQGFNMSFEEIEKYSKENGFLNAEKKSDNIVVCYK